MKKNYNFQMGRRGWQDGQYFSQRDIGIQWRIIDEIFRERFTKNYSLPFLLLFFDINIFSKRIFTCIFIIIIYYDKLMEIVIIYLIFSI